MRPPHNNSSVHLTTTTYVQHSGWITNAMRSGRTKQQVSAFSSPTPAPTAPEWPSQEEPGSGFTGSMTIGTNSVETIQLRPFIWDHVHLRPRHLKPRSFETYSFVTTSFETTFIWDSVHLRRVHLRPHSFETFSFETTFIWDHIHSRPFIWDHIHLRPRSFETTFIWDHIHLRPHSFETTSFETTFILGHIHFRLHSFEITFILRYVKVKLFWFTVYHFQWSAFHFSAGDWSFPRWLFIWKFARLRPSVSRGDSRWFVNASALRAGSRTEAGVIDSGPSLQGGTPWW